MNPNTPIHEYGHVWVESYAEQHPEEWKKFIELLKQNDMWQRVLGNDKYKNIHGDEHKMASEVMARLFGDWYSQTGMFDATRFEDNFDKASLRARIEDFIRKMMRAVADWWNYDVGTPRNKDFNKNIRELLNKPVIDLTGDNEVVTSDGNTEFEIGDANSEFNSFLDSFEQQSLKRNESWISRLTGGMQKYLNNAKQLLLNQSVLTKAKNKHNIDITSLRDLPEKLSNPIAVFKSARNDVNGKVVLVEAKDKDGNNIVVAINMEGNQNGIEVNEITSVYGRENFMDFARWPEKGLLEQGDYKKFQAWFTSLPEYNSQGESKAALEKVGAKIRQISESTILTPEEQQIKSQAQQAGTFMQAPNGEPTHLTEKQWLQVRTRAFKDWFGDWENDPKNASKVLDENGEPLVVYRGSKNANSYTLRSAGSVGYYFTPNREVAKQYVSRTAGKEQEIANMSEEEIDARIQPVFLNVRDMETVDAEGRAWNNLFGETKYQVFDDDGNFQVFDTEQEASDYAQQLGMEADDYFPWNGSTDEVFLQRKQAGGTGMLFHNVIDGGDIPSDVYVIADNTQKGM